MILKVPGTKIYWKSSEKKGDPPCVSWEGGGENTWHFTFRGEQEFREMHPTAVIVEGTDTPLEVDEDAERELFGDTLDDPIPEELWELIK